MQRRQLAPDDLVALYFYVSPLDPDPDFTLETQPSASFQPDPVAVCVPPPWTWQPPQLQPIEAQIVNGTQLVQAEALERRRAGFGTIPYYDEQLKSNALTSDVLHHNSPHSISWIDPQAPQSAEQPQTVYISYYCPDTVTPRQQPALQNIAVDSVRTEVPSSKASASEEVSSKVASVGEQNPVEAPAPDEEPLVANPLEKEVPVIPSRSLDEETLEELASEEYNAIMDSIEIEEWHKSDCLLTEQYKDDEMFLEYLDELCGDSNFVRNVGSELNLNYWESMLSSKADPLDLFAVGNKSREEKTPPAGDAGANVSSDKGPVTLAKSPESDQNVSSDDNKVTETLYKEILDAVASILSDSMDEAATTKEDAEAQAYWVNAEQPTTEGREIIEWLLGNIPLEQETGGSPLLPTDRLEFIQAIPDDYMTTFSTPFDESIYMGFQSPKQSALDSAPIDPDVSSEDLEALAEVWLKDSLEETQSYSDSEGVQPKVGHASPVPLCDLALQVFLNSEQPGDEASVETARRESDSDEGPTALMGRSSVPCSGALSGRDCDIANGDICRNLESEMEDAAKNSKFEALEQEEQLNGEMLVEAQASDKVSICKEENVKRKDKKTVPMRWSRRLSSQILKLPGGDEVPQTIDDKQEKTLHFGHGDNEEKSPKLRAFEELDSIEKTKRRKKREVKESDEKTCFVQTPRCESLGNADTRRKAKVGKAVVVSEQEKCLVKRGRQKAVKEMKEKTIGILNLINECQKKTSAKRRRQEGVEEIEKAVSNSSKKAKTKHPSGVDDQHQRGKASSKRRGGEEGKMAPNQASSTDSNKSIGKTSRKRSLKNTKTKGKRSSATVAGNGKTDGK